MEWISYIFPVLAAGLIIAFLFCCPDLSKVSLRPPDRRARSFSPADFALMAIITALYAVIAFIGLGNTESPQSFCHFDERGSYADIELESGTEIANLRFFAGLNTGKYYVQFSEDGVNFEDAGIMEQTYADIFKWLDWEPNEGAPTSAKYIRIIADSELYMGELAVYDGSGLPMALDRLSFPDGVSTLFDEQDVVPQKATYMNSSYFDEVYHARTAYENIQGIYPYEVSHPPLGKLIIAIGIELFGLSPFGWRFMGTLFGVLMLPALYVFLKKLFGGTAVPACGTLIFAFDFMHFVQTRIATIDTYALFFIILMYLFIYLYVTGGKWRYLALSGIFFGIGVACKWTCLYAGAGLGVIWLLHWIFMGKKFRLTAFIKNCLFCLVFFVVIPCAIYYASYYPYGEAKGLEGIGMYFTKDYADIVWSNQKFMLTYHEGVTSSHPYSSKWYQWILNIRPILYYLDYPAKGQVSSFGAFLNPLVCWGGLLGVVCMGYLAIFRRDKRAGFILIGYLAQLLPWVFISRTTFEYHYFACSLFLVITLCYIFSLMEKYRRWQLPVFGYTGACLGLFALFYPVLTGLTVSSKYADLVLGWLPTWPF